MFVCDMDYMINYIFLQINQCFNKGSIEGN